jgi:GTP-binding nuclear protein Ran
VTSPFKVVIVGDGGVGKTSYLWRFTKGDFTGMYIPTIQVDIFSLKFNTNRGEVLFDVWDVAGQPKHSGHGASV